MRFIGEKFEDAQADMRQECIGNGITDEMMIEAYLSSPNRYKGVVFVPEQVLEQVENFKTNN